MSHDVVLSMEAGEDVLRITMASGSKSAVVNASRQIQEALRSNPAAAGEHLSEGLYYIDCDPLRGFFTIDVDELTVEIVNVKQV